MTEKFKKEKLDAIINELKGLIRHGSMNDEELLQELVEIMSDEMNLPIVIVKTDGIISACSMDQKNNMYSFSVGESLPAELFTICTSIRDESVVDLSSMEEKGLVVPVVVQRETIAYIFSYGSVDKITEMMEVSRVCSIYITLLLKNMYANQQKDEERQRNDIKVALNSMSYTELEALQHLFNAIGGTQGLVVARKIADEIGITRSVIVNALRKLESAGTVESRSLGMKGTFVKVINPYFLEELNKLTL